MEMSLNTANREFYIYNYRTSQVRAVIDDRAQARAACAALTAAGFNDDAVELFSEPEAEREFNGNSARRGLARYFMRRLQHSGLAKRWQANYYEQELAAGHCVLQVETDYRRWEQAHRILKSSGGHFINFYGLLLTKMLDS